jgi:hypothetical protein
MGSEARSIGERSHDGLDNCEVQLRRVDETHQIVGVKRHSMADGRSSEREQHILLSQRDERGR